MDRYETAVDAVCLVCRDLERRFEWTQLALDDTHEIRFRAVECQCGYRLTDAEMILRR